MATRKPRSSTVGKGRSRKVAKHKSEHELFCDEVERLMLEDPALVTLSREIQRLQRRLRRLCSAETWTIYLAIESVVNRRAFALVDRVLDSRER